jgi:hypothetical protein
MTKTYTFKHCWVHASHGYTETVFHDGRSVTAAPEDSDEYRAKAARYGYGDDIHAMSREHEILHTFLAEKLALGSSPTLWALAHPDHDGIAPEWAQMGEESYVLAFQSYVNGGPVTEDLAGLTDACLCLECLRTKAVELLRGD